LKSIKRNAFYGCTGLTALAIPAGVKKADNGAFAGCTSLDNATRDAIIRRFGSKAVYAR
jgi:hypothetical protein